MVKKILALFVVLIVAMACVFAFSDDAKLKALSAAMSAEQSRTSMQKTSVMIDDHEIAYLDRPASSADGEVIFLLHGFTAEKNNWLRFAAHIGEEFRVIAPDWGAHGESTYLPAADYSMPAQADRLNALMEKLDIPRAHLVGSSMGGGISANFASRYPDKVITLSLMNANGVDNPDTESEVEIGVREGTMLLVAKTPEDFKQVFALTMTKPPFIPWPINAALANVAASRHDQYQKVFNDLYASLDRTDVGFLQNIVAPTLIMWGDQDRVIDVTNAEIFSKGLPNSETLIYEGIGHLPMLEIPKQSALDIQTFIHANSPGK